MPRHGNAALQSTATRHWPRLEELDDFFREMIFKRGEVLYEE